MIFTSALRYLKKSAERSPALLTSTAIALGLAVACTVPPAEPDPQSPEAPTAEQPMPPEMVPDRVVDGVLDVASRDLDVPRDELSIRRFNQETWLDSCLGLGRLNESCLQVLVDGWQLEVVYEDESYFYRSDNYGDTVRQSFLENNLPPSIGDRVLQMAAADSGVPVDALEVTEAEPRLWDGCLGIQEPDTVCTQVAIYGWRVVVPGENRLWVYHTDMTGDDIRLNPNETGRQDSP